MKKGYETKLKLASALQELMKESSLNRISIQTLTKHCGANRQTFYYHFADIYDLLQWTYIEGLLKPIIHDHCFTNWEDDFLIICNYISKNLDFVRNTLSSEGFMRLYTAIFEVVFQTCMNSINQKCIENNINPSYDNRKFLANFVTPSFIQLLIDWVKDGARESSNSLMIKLKNTLEGFFLTALRRYSK